MHPTVKRLGAFLFCVSIATSYNLAFSQPASATDDFADAASAKVNYTKPTLKSSFTCASFVGRRIGGATITSATAIAASATDPAFCDVQATIAPSNLIDVALPVDWNQRLYGLGNGGCGEPLAADIPARNLAVARSFAVVSSDTGHEGNVFSCAFADHRPDLAVDYSFKGIHDATLAAKDIMRVFYRRGPERSYYNSCSDGGHDGLEEVQRYPKDYDGVVAGSPLLGTGTIFSDGWVTKGYASIPMSEQMTPAKVAYIQSVVYGKCDRLDGLVDGIINDPRDCSRVFDPRHDLKRCAGMSNANDCLTKAQLDAYIHMLTPVQSVGRPYYPPYALGVEQDLIGTQIPPPGTTFATGSVDYILSQSTAQYIFPWPSTNPSEFNLFTLNFDRDPYRIFPARVMFDPANLDMRPFFARGGKLISYHGWADPLITPYGTVALYEDEHQLFGNALASSFRLFMVPGMGHCVGGSGADQFDPVTKIVDWVEAKTDPRTILSRHFVTGTTNIQFTRTLCAYPLTARYVGGNRNVASSFRCVPGPLGVPGTGRDDGLQLP